MSSLLGVHAVEVPGRPERDFLTLADRLVAAGWAVTVTSPTPYGPLAHSGHPHVRLDVGGLGAGEGARAVASWPRARRLGREHDVIYLNSTVCGRLLPALRGARTVLHVHDVVERVPRHWHQADVVLVPSDEVAERLDGLVVHVVPPPAEVGADAYAAAVETLIAPEAALRAGHA